MHVDRSLRLEEGAAQLAYRIVREGLRNVVKHADASSALVEIRREDGWVHVVVADDGRGLDADARDAVDALDTEGADDTESGTRVGDELPAEEGHLGLRLLRDSVQDAARHARAAPEPAAGHAAAGALPRGRPRLLAHAFLRVLARILKDFPRTVDEPAG